MNKKTKYLYVLIIVLILAIASSLIIKTKNFTKETNTTKGNYNVYLETSSGSGTYSPSSSSVFPTSGYTFNAEKSKCVNGSTLSYNNETKTISLTTNKSDKCNVYFDRMKVIEAIKATVRTETPDFSQIEPRIASYTDNGFSTSTSTYNLSSTYTAYYYTYASSYTYNTATNTYTLVSPTTAKYSDCYTILPGKYVIRYNGTSSSSGSSYTNVSKIYKVTNATYDSSALTGAITRNNLNSITTNYDSSLSGLYSAPDDYGTSYYYRGAVTNNYVQFAGFYWRIIRINGDGSLRIIYDGTSAHANGESSTDRQIGTSPFNTNNNDNAYVGYMYGTPGSIDYASTHANTNSSTIKTYIDAWYKTNIVDTGNSSAIADVIYCNDRQISGSGLGYGTNATDYMAYNRLATNKTPKLSCTQKNDAFTVNDTTKGNGALTYPVGLITADEASYAGKTRTSSNISDYLYTGNYYWSAAPDYFYDDYARGFSVNGGLGISSVAYTYGARPVISLSAEYCENLQGDGLMTNPYKAP